MGPRRGDLAV